MHSELSPVWIGHLTDGRSAQSIEVDISLMRDGVRIARRHSDAAAGMWLYEGLSANVPLTSSSREVVLATRAMPGATLRVADASFVAALIKQAPHLGVTAVRLEGLKPGATVGALVLAMAGAIYAFNLSPSKGIASLMPEKARQTLGESVLKSMPIRTQCDAEPGKQALAALVRRLAPDDPGANQRIVVLDWNVVNAFAVPGGRVVLTRAIIQRAASADEVAGVVAHELGHGSELHPEAGLVRSVGFWALIQMVFTGTPGAIGNAGQMLAQLAYSRTSEREADDFALDMLKKAGISPKPFAALFRRLDGNRGPSSGDSGRFSTRDLFSTHPASPERIAKIEGQPAYPVTPALTDAQWQNLRQICGADFVIPPPPPTNTPETPPPAPKPPNFDAQIATMTDRIAARPDDAFHWRSRGMVYAGNNMLKEAIADLDRAIELAPKNAGYRNDRGNLHFRQRTYASAEADYSESIKLNPQAPLPYAARGVVHRMEKRYDAAMADFAAALAITPTYEYAILNRGLVYRDKEQWREAVADFTTVIDRNGKHPSAYGFRGQVLEKLGERDKAIADYRKALATQGTTNAAFARARLVALGETP